MKRILFLGDIVSNPGRTVVKFFLQEHKQDYDFIAANVENSAGGLGVTKKILDDLHKAGIDAFTGGNHLWKYKEFVEYFFSNEFDFPFIRPANYPEKVKGKKILRITKDNITYSVAHFLGRIFMGPLDCPFEVFDRIYPEIKDADFKLVDFHAEATSEKKAFGYYLDGKVNACIGTHTHVQTSDAQLLDQNTAYITDAGMCGIKDSVLGVKKEIIIKKLKYQVPIKFIFAKTGIAQINAAEILFDEKTKKNIEIKHLQKEYKL